MKSRIYDFQLKFPSQNNKIPYPQQALNMNSVIMTVV